MFVPPLNAHCAARLKFMQGSTVSPAWSYSLHHHTATPKEGKGKKKGKGDKKGKGEKRSKKGKEGSSSHASDDPSTSMGPLDASDPPPPSLFSGGSGGGGGGSGGGTSSPRRSFFGGGGSTDRTSGGGGDGGGGNGGNGNAGDGTTAHHLVDGSTAPESFSAAREDLEIFKAVLRAGMPVIKYDSKGKPSQRMLRCDEGCEQLKWRAKGSSMRQIRRAWGDSGACAFSDVVEVRRAWEVAGWWGMVRILGRGY